MNEQSNYPAGVLVDTPTILEPEDQERILQAIIARQNLTITTALLQIKHGAPHEAMKTLEQAEL